MYLCEVYVNSEQSGYRGEVVGNQWLREKDENGTYIAPWLRTGCSEEPINIPITNDACTMGYRYFDFRILVFSTMTIFDDEPLRTLYDVKLGLTRGTDILQ